MSIERRYYRVESGALPAAAKSLHEERTRAKQLITAFMADVGARSFEYSNFDGRVIGFDFQVAPSPVWKRARGSYRPKLNSAEGKALAERIKQLPAFTPMESALASVGITHHSPMLLGDGRCWFATLTGCATRGIWFVSIPTLGEQGQSGERFKPPAEWMELKGWEVERDIELINAEIRGADQRKPS